MLGVLAITLSVSSTLAAVAWHNWLLSAVNLEGGKGVSILSSTVILMVGKFEVHALGLIV
jgi:hypothetical protein